MNENRDGTEQQRRLRATRKRVALIAHWLDSLVAIPGTSFRIGIDGVVGLIPGIGDLAGMLMGSTILFEGVRIGAPNLLIVRMLSNTVIDGMVGSVPVFGDLFDFAYRSNSKNARLLLQHLDRHADTLPSRPVSRWPLLAAVFLVPFIVFALAILGLIALFHKIL